MEGLEKKITLSREKFGVTKADTAETDDSWCRACILGQSNNNLAVVAWDSVSQDGPVYTLLGNARMYAMVRRGGVGKLALSQSSGDQGGLHIARS